ncbi:hypothetical protein F0562_017234 [Nyssa sinensis]|uniref:Uncharacterized protein n=1 Tax=Nyssa sinensis TaxID=561372 RepID=A0A5J4ZHD4_9ASTE|nr:hypothetical protein F0562_017234 [Nyssa sinensis]
MKPTNRFRGVRITIPHLLNLGFIFPFGDSLCLPSQLYSPKTSHVSNKRIIILGYCHPIDLVLFRSCSFKDFD